MAADLYQNNFDAIQEGLPSLPDILWECRIGEGSFGVVYKAHDRFQGIDLAVKKRVLLRKRGEQEVPADGDDTLQLFLNECQNWIHLDLHPNIANCYYVRPLGDTLYIFMEYIAGRSLQDWIRDERIRTLPLLLRLAYQAALGVRHVHAKGLVHQDLKPGNILVDEVDGAPLAKVSDFTTSAKLDSKGEAPSRVGTRAFASPEQLAGRAKITPGSDLWSWALTVLQMFSQSELPGWLPDRNEETGNWHCTEYLNYYYERSRSYPAWIQMPESIHGLLLRCLQEAPSTRPRDASEIVDSLREAYQEETGKTLPDPPTDSIILDAIHENNKGVSSWNIGAYHEGIGSRNAVVNYRAALESFDRALENYPDYLTALYNQSLVRWAVGALPSDTLAIAGLKSRIESSAQDGHFWLLLGRLYAHAMNAEESAKAYSKARELNPSDPSIPRYLEELKEASREFPHRIVELPEDAHCIALSGDGTRTVTKGFSDKFFRIWDVGDVAKVACVKEIESEDEYLWAAALSSDGRLAATSHEEGTIHVWDLEGVERVWTRIARDSENHTCSASHLLFLPQDDLLLSADDMAYGRERSLRFWNHRTGEPLKVITVHRDTINSVALSRDGTRIVTTGNDNLVKLWHYKPDELGLDCIASFEGSHRFAEDAKPAPDQQDHITSADIDRANRRLLYGTNDASIYLRDVLTNEDPRQFRGHTGPVRSVQWMEDDRFAISCSAQEIKIWDMHAGICLSTFPAKERLGAFVMVPNRRTMLVPDGDAVQIWHTGEISPLRPDLLIDKVSHARADRTTLPLREKIEVAQAATRDLESVATLIEQHAWGAAYQRLAAFKQVHHDMRHHARVRQLTHRIDEGGRRMGIGDVWLDGTIAWEDQAFGSGLCGLAASRDGREVIAVSHDGLLYAANIAGKRITKLLTTNSRIACVEVLDARRLAVGIFGGIRNADVAIWDLSTLEVERVLGKQRFLSGISSLSSCERAGRLAAAIGGGSVFGGNSCTVWDIHSGEVLFEHEPNSNIGRRFCSVCLSAAGHLVLLGESRLSSQEKTLGTSELSLWSIERKERLLKLTGLRGEVLFVAFRKSDTMALAVNKDATVTMWDLKLGRCVRAGRCADQPIVSACMTADENYLVVLDEQGTIRVCRLDDLRCIRSCSTQADAELSHVTVTPDAHYILAGGGDRTIWVFGMDWEYAFPGVEPELPSVAPPPRGLALPDGSEIHPFIPLGHRSDISTLAVHGFRYLLSGSLEATIKVWDLLENGLCVKTLAGHAAKVTAIVTGHGGTIFTAALDHRVIRWDINTSRVEHVFELESPANVLEIDPDAQVLFAGCADGTLCRWDATNGAPLGSAKLEGSITTMLACPRKHLLLVGTSGGGAFALDPQTLAQVRRIEGAPNVVRILPKETEEIYIGDNGGQIRVVNLESFEVSEVISAGPSISDFLVHGSALVTCNFGFNDSSVTIRDMKTGAAVKEIRNIGWIRALAPFPLSFFFVGLSHGNILMVNVADGEFSGFLPGLRDQVACVKISPDRRYIITGYPGDFHVYDLASGRHTQFESESNVVDVDFDVNGQFAFAKDYRDRVSQVDLASMSVARKYQFSQLGNVNTVTGDRGMDFDTFEDAIVSVVIRSAEGVHLFHQSKIDEAGGLGAMDEQQLKDILTRSQIRYMSHGSLCQESSFSNLTEVVLVDMCAGDKKPTEPIRFEFDSKDPQRSVIKALIADDGDHLVTVGRHGAIGVWEISSRRLVRTITDEEDKDYCTKAVAMLNGNILIAGGASGRIKLWNIRTGDQMGGYTAHTGQVSWISMSPDRELILTCGSPDGMRIWSAATFELLASLVLLRDDEYVLYTPYDEFYVSDPRLLQFEKVSQQDGRTSRTFVADVKSQQQYREHFVDLHKVRERLGRGSAREGGSLDS